MKFPVGWLAIFSLAVSCFVGWRQVEIKDMIESHNSEKLIEIESRLNATESIAAEPLKNEELLKQIRYIRFLITEHEARRTEDMGPIRSQLKRLEEETSFQAAQDADHDMQFEKITKDSRKIK
jgi:hypothetical protein